MTRVSPAQHRAMACAITRRRAVSDDWILSVGRVRSKAVWSPVEGGGCAKLGSTAGQAFPILRSSAHAFLERGACSASSARISPIAPPSPRPFSRFAFLPLFRTALFLTSAPADSTTFAGLGLHPDTRIVRLVSSTLVRGPGTTFNICLFNLLSAEAKKKLQPMSAFSLRNVGCQE